MRIGLIMIAVICLVTLGVTTSVLAAESWVADPATGGKIGWVSDSSTLVAATWTGPLADGKAEGKGSLTIALRDNDGKETKGTVDAEMKAGKLEGRVSIKWSDGDSFDGFYKDGLREGRGVYKASSGLSYDGDWQADRIAGKGVLRLPNGLYYEGDFQNGKKDGQGREKYADGGSYEGAFQNDQRNGRGIYRWFDGKTLDGGWKNNLPDGLCIMKDAVGNVLGQTEYREGQAVTPADGQPAAVRGKLPGFMGLTWGTAKEGAEKLILARPGSRWFDKKNNTLISSFNDQPAFLTLVYKEGQLVSGRAWLPATEDEVLPLFEKLKALLTDKYGKADQEAGKYLDSTAQWNFPAIGPNDYIVMRILKTDAFVTDQTLPSALRKPFSITLAYVKGDVQDQQVQQQKQSGGKDL